MKKILLYTLCFVLVVFTTACQNETTSTESSLVSSVDSSIDEDTSSNINNEVNLPITNTAFPKDYVEPKPVEYVKDGKTFVKQYPSNISLYKYCGHWQADENDPNTFVSYWNVAYVEVDFTGTTIFVEFSKPSRIKVSIDGGDFVSYDNADGRMEFKAKTDGKHTIQIRNNGKHDSEYRIDAFNYHVYFAGVSVPKGETLSRTADKPHYVQFIGDSITHDERSHGNNSANMLGWDYSVVAKAAMSLQSGYGYWHLANKNMLNVLGKNVGMEDAFFKLGYPDDSMSASDRQRYSNYFNDDTLNFNFYTGNTPDVVFIFIGTNDGLTGPSRREEFVLHYVAFVEKIMASYGNKPQIFLMQALSASYSERYTSINLAGTTLAEKYPGKVTFINRETVDSWGVEIGSDGTHPSTAGYATLAEQVALYLHKNVK